jgi:hypothetical protein
LGINALSKDKPLGDDRYNSTKHLARIQGIKNQFLENHPRVSKNLYMVIYGDLTPQMS